MSNTPGSGSEWSRRTNGDAAGQSNYPASGAGQTPPPPTPSGPPAGYPATPGTQNTAPTTPLGPRTGAPASQPGSVYVTPQGTTYAPQGPSGQALTATTQKSRDGRVGAGKVIGILVAACLVGGAAGLGGAAAGVTFFGASSSETQQSEDGTITINDTDSVNQTSAVAAKALPSVVTISAETTDSAGTGSGVILSEDGYVVTNTHVVTLDGSTSDATLRVTDSSGNVYDAEVVGTDPVYDLAVIKLEGASGLTPIEFADSSALNVGDTTVALGAPLGLSNTVTTGIVSALNRSISIASSAAPEQDETTPQDEGEGGEEAPFQFDFGEEDQQQTGSSGTISIAVIQTDAAINPGNSGGALVDSEGKLIGINVAIASAGDSSSSGSIGVGFSIPSNIVQRVTDEIIANGSATHGLLGATVSAASARDDATVAGAYVESVTDGGAAQVAGLQAGDVVTDFGGIAISDSIDLTAQVRSYASGETVSLTYRRDGESHTVDVTLGDLVQ